MVLYVHSFNLHFEFRPRRHVTVDVSDMYMYTCTGSTYHVRHSGYQLHATKTLSLSYQYLR